MLNKNLKKRTPGEDYFLCRLHRGLTQPQAAKVFLMGSKKYRRVEADKVTDITPPTVRPSLGQLCALARRRHGKGLRATAKLLGMSHVTLLARERANDPELVGVWGRLGYRF